MRRQDISVGDLMSRAVVSIAPEESLERAAQKMKSSDIRHLPVVDHHGAVVGMLSDRELLTGLLAHPSQKVREAMSPDVLTVQPETRACEATELMLDRKIDALPVVEPSGKLVGLLTETDFLRVAHRLLGGDHLADPHPQD